MHKKNRKKNHELLTSETMKLLENTKSKITKNENGKNFIFLKTFNSEFSYIELWFADQNPKPIETED